MVPFYSQTQGQIKVARMVESMTPAPCPSLSALLRSPREIKNGVGVYSMSISLTDGLPCKDHLRVCPELEMDPY